MRPAEQLRARATELVNGRYTSPPVVRGAVDARSGGALGVPAPAGDPDLLRDTAASFRNGGANLLDQASEDLDHLRRDRLPQVWDSRWGSQAAAARLEHTARHAAGCRGGIP